MNNISTLIPLPLLIISLFYLLGAGIRRIGKRYTGCVIATIVLTLLLFLMLMPILPFPFLAVLFIFGFIGGIVIARNDRTIKIAIIIQVIVVALLSITQFITISGLSRRIPPLRFFFKTDLVYFNFNEILFGSIMVAFIYMILQRYLCNIYPTEKNNGRCILLAVGLTYLIDQFIHLEHPELGYKIIFGHEFSSQWLSILSFGGLFWTIVFSIIIVLSLYFGIVLYLDNHLLNNISNKTYNSLKIGAVYFGLFHLISLSFLYSNNNLLNGIMMIMLSAISIPFGVSLGYAFNQLSIDKLSLAARDGKYDQVINVLAKGIEVNKKDKDGFTPLILTAHNGHIKIVRLLLENGAKVDMKDVYGCTALSSACSKGHYGIAKILISEGANLNSKDNDGNSPYIAAIFGGHTKICELLAKNGVNTQEKHPILGVEPERINQIIGPFHDFVRKHKKD